MKSKDRFAVGTRHKNTSGFWFAVTSYKSSKEIYVLFDSGFTTKTTATRLRRGNMRDRWAPCMNGIGINDVGLNHSSPYYSKWANMFTRCYSEAYHKKRDTYIGCTVCDEWVKLSGFISWVDSQPEKAWEKCCLDKDLIVNNNKKYSPDTCVFIKPYTNIFLECRKGVNMAGAHQEPSGNWSCACNPLRDTDSRYLGVFPTEFDAHVRYCQQKHMYAQIVAETEDDPRVKEALISRWAVPMHPKPKGME